MVNFKTITRIIGILLLLETAMLLACSGISLYYQDEALTDFWKSAGIAAGKECEKLGITKLSDIIGVVD